MTADDSFKPAWEWLRQYNVSEWYQNGKFDDWYAREMYMEGNKNTSTTWINGYSSKFGFKNVIHRCKAKNCNPARDWWRYIKKQGRNTL